MYNQYSHFVVVFLSPVWGMVDFCSITAKPTLWWASLRVGWWTGLTLLLEVANPTESFFSSCGVNFSSFDAEIGAMGAVVIPYASSLDILVYRSQVF